MDGSGVGTGVGAWLGDGEPKVMWLSGLSIPETYTAALVQTTCRRYGWPLDKTTLFTKVTKFTQASDVKEKLVDGCYIIGLYIEGAAWDVPHELAVHEVANAVAFGDLADVLGMQIPLLKNRFDLVLKTLVNHHKQLCRRQGRERFRILVVLGAERSVGAGAVDRRLHPAC